MHIGMSGIVKLLWVKRIAFIFSVFILSSPDFPGLGFGTVPRMLADCCQGFFEPNLFALLNKIKHSFKGKNI